MLDDSWCQPDISNCTVGECRRKGIFAPCGAVAKKSSAPKPDAVVQDVLALRQKLQLYNTMSRSKEVFSCRPETPNRVQMYVCGVTVYDFSHIGA